MLDNVWYLILKKKNPDVKTDRDGWMKIMDGHGNVKKHSIAFDDFELCNKLGFSSNQKKVRILSKKDNERVVLKNAEEEASDFSSFQIPKKFFQV